MPPRWDKKELPNAGRRRIIAPLMTEYAKRIGLLLGLPLLLAACTSSHKKAAEPATPADEAPMVVKQRIKKNRPTIQQRQEVKEAPENPEPPAAFQPQMPGNRIAQVSVPGPYVALTFDDGPNPNTTPQVLDILRRLGAKATFFVLGENAVRHGHIVARAAAEGHEIGSHTWDHPNLTRLSREAIISQMDRTADTIRSAIGHNPAVMRPPYGATNENIINLMASRYGTPSIMWSVDTQDWKHPGVDVVIHRVVDRAKSGSIILLHDIHASTVAAVEGVVRGLQERGFRLVTVSELIAMGRRSAGEGGYPRPGLHLFAASGEGAGNSLPPTEPPNEGSLAELAPPAPESPAEPQSGSGAAEPAPAEQPVESPNSAE